MHISFICIAVAAVALLRTASAYKHFQNEIPNGNRVPSPCQAGAIWSGVGHQSPAGANARNPFGLDFSSAGHKWTTELCRKDSDGDGLTNGQELGDPDCVWTPGATPTRTAGLSHPGICPLDSTSCKNSWTVCPKAFNCPALTEAGVTMRNFTLNSNTPVPAKETTYICQAFELNNTATPVHMIGSRPIIVNDDIMHHMIMYACNTRPDENLFNSPQICFMSETNCIEMINLWTKGLEGECFNSNAGIRIGGAGGFQYGILQLHWNNPKERSDYTDSSGFSLYFKSKLRDYDQGTLTYGEMNLVLPPRQPRISFYHTCPSVCTRVVHKKTRFITAAAIHMHTHGSAGRISLWRNGTLVKELDNAPSYDYNSPVLRNFDPPIEYHPGDEVKTECHFNTTDSDVTIFYGEGTKDEMCYAFLSYYPNNVNVDIQNKLGYCVGYSGINNCWHLLNQAAPQIENECNITAMRSGEIPNRVKSEMTHNECFKKTGCNPACRDYLNNTLWPSDACYDPKRARQMAEVMAISNTIHANLLSPVDNDVMLTIRETLFGQRLCEQEIHSLADWAKQTSKHPSKKTPAGQSGNHAASTSRGLTSEHLLAIIIAAASALLWR